jgi:xylulokinase
VSGRSYYEPDELWETVAGAIAEAAIMVDPIEIAVVGLTSMAESGLLVDRGSGMPRSEIIPWFDLGSSRHAADIAREATPFERFQRTGLRPSFKFGLAKLLWLREHDPEAHHGAVWLSVADYIAFRLTGQMATDYSLAARTYAFRVDTRSWDEEWIRFWGFEPAMFPLALPSGQATGGVRVEAAAATGLRRGTPVAIAGHDHLCAAVAAGAHHSGVVFDSMGTAESMLGTLPRDHLGEAEFSSGLSFGRHVAGDSYFWLGGLASSGGSIEWLRRQLGEPPLTYDQLQVLLAQAADEATGILYFPYLSGSGTPWTDPTVQAGFIGLRASHGRPELLKAVLEGTAYEIEAIRRAGEQVSGTVIDRICAVGGGTRLQKWMQIKADISGCRYDVAALDEAAVLGAAIVAGAGCGVYGGIEEAMSVLARYETTSVLPDTNRHQVYRRLYEQGFLSLQAPLRGYYNHAATQEQVISGW